MEFKDLGRILIQRYFQEHSIVDANIESFNSFVDNELQVIIDENKEIEPTIIPSNVDSYKIRLEKIEVGKPEIIEADGSTRNIYPTEVRLRRLSYTAPIYLEISAYVNEIPRESLRVQIGNLPIMVKSKYCHLKGLSKEELIKLGEDPNDPGGYFLINGAEKVIVTIEELANNRFVVEYVGKGVSEYVGKLFSEKGSYKIQHVFEKLKDNIFYLSFTRVKRLPIIPLIKALGITKDEEIMKIIGLSNHSEVIINLYDFMNLKTEEEAIDFISKKIGITQTKEIRIERTKEILSKYLLPHIGIGPEYNKLKAYNLCKYLRQFLLVSDKKVPPSDRDHFMNKKLKMSGELLADLFRANIKILIGDMLYNFQRLVKRGKFPSIKTIVREKLLTQKVFSSMATGNWVGGRTGVCQRLELLNFLQTQSHLQRVVNPLSSSQENFEARALHPTSLGRLCPSETPEGSNIGLRKNLAMLARISRGAEPRKVYESLLKIGLKPVEDIKDIKL